jgi:hypothetical protein
MNSLDLCRGVLIFLLAILILGNCSCKRSQDYLTLNEVPKYGRYFGATKSRPVTWVTKNKFGYGIGKCEMALDEFEEFTKTMGLDCQFVLTEIGNSNRHFESYFSIDPKAKVYTALGPICPSDRGCHFYGYFAPNGSSNNDVGTLWFTIQ